LLLVSSKQKLWSSKRTACDQQSISPNHGGSSSVLNAYKLSYQQVVHIPHSLQAQKMYLTHNPAEKQGSDSIPNQHIQMRNASLIRHRISQPALFQKESKGILNQALILQPLL
jgi:hypothetical protein